MANGESDAVANENSKGGMASKRRVLVAYASRHGSTREIADTIQGALVDAGVQAEMSDVDGVGSLEGYDAVLLGSAVYLGRWLKSARDFAIENREELSAMPVWLFSSGPIGDAPAASDDPLGVDTLEAELGARGHHLFSGKLDKSELGLAERAVIRVVGAKEGDYRDWEDVGAWAKTIATELAAI